MGNPIEVQAAGEAYLVVVDAKAWEQQVSC